MSDQEPHFTETSLSIDLLLNAIEDGVFVTDRSYRIVRVNRWMTEKYARAMPLVGKNAGTVLTGAADGDPAWPAIDDLLSGNPFRQTLPYPSAKDQGAWFAFSLRRIDDPKGIPSGAVGQLRDITEQQQIEMRLKDEVNRRRTLVEQSRDGIVILDHNGKVYEANQRYADMLGYTLAEVQKLHVWDWDAQWEEAQLIEMVKQIDDAGDRFETRHRRKDGSQYDVEICTNGVVFGGQKLILCICRDITDRKRAESERERLITDLRAALKEIKTLEGILPLCSFCKRIRNDQGDWEPVDVYIFHHSQADISHSICPDCLKQHYGD